MLPPVRKCVLVAFVLLGAPAAAQKLEIVSGDGQIVLEEFRSTAPLVVRATGQNGAPAAGVPITWSVPFGRGGVVGEEMVTDAEGLARAYFVATSFEGGLSFDEIPVTAAAPFGSVQFRVVTAIIRLPGGTPAAPPLVELLAPRLTAPPFEGQPGQRLPEAVIVRVTVQSGIQVGEPIPDVGVRIVSAADPNQPVPVSCAAPGGMVFTGVDGLARCDLLLGDQPGNYRLAAYVGEMAITPWFRLVINEPGGGGPGGEPTALAITTPPVLPAATAGSAYSTFLAAAGGVPPYTWSVAGTLPEGLELNPATGELSGVPASASTTQFTVTVTDSAGAQTSQTFTLTVVSQGGPPETLTITTEGLPGAVVGQDYFAAIVVQGGCISPFNPARLSIAGGGLPPGLEIVGGAIRGTPSQTGIFQFTAEARDVCGAVASRVFVITVNGPGGESPQPAIAADPASLTFERNLGGEPPSPQTIQLSAAGTEAFHATATTSTGSAWLSVTPAAGTTPATLTVAVSPAAQLDPGTYLGEITVQPDTPGAAPTRIPVTLIVAGEPELVVSPATLGFTISQGAPPPTQQVISVASSGAPVAFAVTVRTETGGEWLFVTPTAPTTPANLFVAVNPVGLLSGTYRGVITIERSDKPEAREEVIVVLQIPQPQPAIQAVTNAGSFHAGPIAPHEILVLFGRHLGPDRLAAATAGQDGLLPTDLAETRVLFDETPAPLIYTLDGQVAVIAPGDIAGKRETAVQLVYRGVASNVVTAAVADAAPGVFTADGSGQGAIINQNGTINSLANPAQPGEAISIFATGAGLMSPAHPDGAIIPVTQPDLLPRPALPVKVEIGGQEAEVLYAGAAPLLPNGVLQVNVALPAGLAPGAVPLTIRVGSFASQEGVTVAVGPAP